MTLVRDPAQKPRLTREEQLALLTRDPLEYLNEVPSLWNGIAKFDLDTMRLLLPELGNPQDKVPAVHVGGTNGKGTTCSYVAAMLFGSGFTVGQTSSPHLHHVTERCLIDGVPLSVEDYGRSVREVVEAAERQNLSPSFFEITSAVAFLAFARKPVDWMVIEVGLGGRLDATNTMSAPRACVISSIGLDHTNVLGDTKTEIAREKAGIFRRGIPVFVGAVDDEAHAELKRAAVALGAPIEFFGRDFGFDARTSTVCWEGGKLQVDPSEFGMLSPHQISNMAVAVRTAKHLGVTDEAVLTGLRVARWPGRLEWFDLGAGSKVLIDGAHNPEGMRALIEFVTEAIDRSEKFTKVTFLLSFLEHKDWKQMLRIISDAPFEKQIVFAPLPHAGGASLERLQETIPGSHVTSSVEGGLIKAQELSQDSDLIVAAGSLYFLGALRPLLTSEPFTTIAED